jgi:hypothetical protein
MSRTSQSNTAERPLTMLPSPPLVTQRRGSAKGYHCAANIWCCPTPVVMMASPLVSS